ncbi:hypothetical protein [Acetobacter sp.]|uniref:hypothetical protein n=1 Tax=Acetobacter sp. TaxID=440 RepID=UPI0039EB5F6D
MTAYLLTASVCLSAGGLTSAKAQVSSREGIALQDQIMELRQQLSQMQTTSNSLPAPVPQGSSGSSSANGDIVTQLLDRVNSLETQQREMRGQLDELTNQVKEQSASLSKQMSDMQFAAQSGGAAGAGAAAGAAAASSSRSTSSATASSTASSTSAEDALKAGNAALTSHDFAKAQSDAQSALAHGKGAVKVDAQYLLGQSLAGQKQYRDSAVAYYDAYKLSPKGARAPYALLGVSASLLSLGDKKAACQAISKLKSEFPNPSERVAKSTAVFSKRGDCS